MKQLKHETYALYLAYRASRVPWYARIFVVCVAAYAFSPLDLIPDFIPVLGYLDDLVLVPLGIVLAIKMIPPEVLEECRARAKDEMRQPNWVAAGVIVVLWLLLAGVVLVLVLKLVG